MATAFKQKRANTENLIARLIHEALDSEEGRAAVKKRKTFFFAAILAGIVYFAVYFLVAHELIDVFFQLTELKKGNDALSAGFYVLFACGFLSCLQSTNTIVNAMETAFSLLIPEIALFALFFMKKLGVFAAAEISLMWAIVALVVFIVFFSLRLGYGSAKKKELRLIDIHTAPYYTVPCEDTNEFTPYVLNRVKNISYLRIAHAVILILLPLTFFIPFIEILGTRVSIFTFIKEGVQKYILLKDDNLYLFLELYLSSFEKFASKLCTTFKFSCNATSMAKGLGFTLLFILGGYGSFGFFYGICKIFQECKYLGRLQQIPTDCDYISKQDILQRAMKTKEGYLTSLPLRFVGYLLIIAFALVFFISPVCLYYQFYMGLTDGKLGGVDEFLYSVNPLLLFIPLLLYAVIVILPIVVVPFMEREEKMKAFLWHFPLKRATMWSKYQKRL